MGFFLRQLNPRRTCEESGLGLWVLGAGLLPGFACASGSQPESHSGPSGDSAVSLAMTGDEPVVERLVSCMGTLATLCLWGEDRAQELQASEAAVQALEETERRLSTWLVDSELARLNRSRPGTRVPLSPATLHELRRAAVLQQRTQGAFDPAIGALIEAWDLRGAGRIPSEVTIVDLLGAAHMGGLEFGADFARRADERLRLDAGAFGKGAGLDRALDALRERGVGRASIDLGGQVALLSAGAGFEIGVAHPEERGRVVATLYLEGGSLATTGNSERGHRLDGVLIGHVLDPRTGRPAHEHEPELALSSVSVWASSALDADAYATALFVLGPSVGLELVERTEGLEALYLIPRATGLKGLASRGFEGRLRMLAPDLDLTFRP